MLKFRSSIKRFFQSGFTLDKVAAVLAFCLGALFLLLAINSGRYAAHLPFGLTVIPLFYLIFRGKLSHFKNFTNVHSSNRIRTISHILFLISISLIFWLIWNNLYYRPPLFFVLLVVAAASIVLNILYLDDKRQYVIVPLFKIFVLNIMVYGSIYYEFYTAYGHDALVHTAWIQGIINEGSIDVIGGEYHLFPLFHINGAVTQIVTSLSIRSSTFFSVVMLMAVSCTFVFLIGRKLVNTKVGLLAALTVSLANNYISEAVGTRAMSLGICFFTAILYLICFREKKNGLVYSALLILLSISLILTHTVAAFVTLVTLITLLGGIKFYKIIYKSAATYEPVSLSLIVFFGAAMILRWMQTPPEDISFFDWNITHLTNALKMDTKFIPVTPSEYSGLPFSERLHSFFITIVSDGGYLIILALAMIGGLVYLHPQNRTRLRTAIIIIAATLFIIPYGSAMLHLKNITPDRWITFSYLPLSIIAIQGLLSICNLLKANAGKLIMVFTVVILIIASMTALNGGANSDSPLYFNYSNRIGYTESEVTAIKTLFDIGAGLPSADRYYCIALPYLIDEESFIEMLKRPNEVFILRNYYLHHSEWNERFKTQINTANLKRPGKSDEILIIDYVKIQGIDKNPLIYDNGNIWVYAMPI